MAKDFWDKFKISSEALKANWPILVLCFTGLSSLATNAAQMVTNQDLEQKRITEVREVATAFQSVLAEPYVEPKTPSCGNCGSLLKSHINKLH